jgi:hypothetical protein
MNANVELNEFRNKIKENICNVVVDIYKQQNNNELPNWEEDEEIVVDANQLPNKSILLEVYCPNGEVYEKQLINEYIVTLDYNLYVHCGNDELENEIHWSDINTDDLVSLLDVLNEYKSILNK